MTTLHSRGESTPPCRHLLAVDAFKVSSDNVVIMLLLYSIEQIHLQIVGSVPHLSTAYVIASNEVKSTLCAKECS
jgi:hypothetical protein